MRSPATGISLKSSVSPHGVAVERLKPPELFVKSVLIFGILFRERAGGVIIEEGR